MLYSIGISSFDGAERGVALVIYDAPKYLECLVTSPVTIAIHYITRYS